MMKNWLVAGEIKYRHRRGTSIACIARSLNISWTRCNNLLQWDPDAAVQQRTPRPPLNRIQKRRQQVMKLAQTITTTNNLPHPEFASANKIAQKLGVSRSTVIRDLKASGFVCRVRHCHSSMDPTVKAKRVAFAKAWLRKPQRSFNEIVFSDEHVITLNDNSSRTQWIRRGGKTCGRERKNPRNASPVLVWGAVGVKYRKLIILHNNKTKYRRGRPKRGEVRAPWEGPYRLTSEKYIRDVLKPVHRELRGRIFQQDGARPHVGKVTMGWIRRNRVNVVENWPPYSPQLSPVENCWSLLDRGISERHPTDTNSLIRAAQEAWAAIPENVIDSTVLSFRSRLQRSVASNGLY